MILYFLERLLKDFITDGGIITPNFFEGKLGLSDNYEISEKEIIFKNSLLKVLNDENYKMILNENKLDLLNKFDLKKVSEDYLKVID